MTNYSDHYSKKKTQQSESIQGKDMIKNNAGGYVFEASLEQQFRRFLILGTESGSYYVREKELTIENAKAVERFINEKGIKAVDLIVEVSTEGQAYKNDPALFALAIAVSCLNDDVRKYALSVLPKVARIGTHLFHFLEFVKGWRGWGRGLRKAVANWYLLKDNKSLAFQSIKYQQRDGWSHRDALRLSHPKTKDEEKDAIFKWITHKEIDSTIKGNGIELIKASEEAKIADKTKLIKLIKDYSLPRETIPTEFLTNPDIWKELLCDMGITALIRNLGNMSKIGLLSYSNDDVVKYVTEKLSSEEILKKGRIHPIQLLAALFTYSAGHGVRGKGEWEPVPQVIDTLDDSFYKTFKMIEPTNKSIILALDVSSSMSWGTIGGAPGLTPRIASAALALVTANTEKNYKFLAFYNKISTINISPKQRLDDVIKYISNFPFGATDCSLPMIWALENKVKADAFVILTDSETWIGKIHPMQALEEYRRKMNLPHSKLIVVGMISNKFSIADPKDPNCLDIVGFDTTTPQLISEFIKEKF